MLKGTLDDFAVTDVFRLLGSMTRTGRLDLERPAGSGYVLFKDGHVVYAETSLSTSLLGQKLVASGALTETQLRVALDERAETGKRLGQIVVKDGLVDEKELAAALIEQIQDAVFELLQWETGDFTWDPSEDVEVDVEASFDVDALLKEVVKRLDEMDMLQQRIPSTGAIPVLASRPPEGAEAITMSPLEWQTMVSVNGTRTVAEIAQALGRPEIDTMRTLFSLVSAGLIEMRAADGESIELDVESSPGTEAAPAEPNGSEPPQETPVSTGETVAPAVAAADGEEPPTSDWFSDPVDAVEPMSTGSPSDFDLDSVEVSVEEVAGSAEGSEDPPSADVPDVAFPSSDLPVVDRAAAARELSGLSAEDPRRAKAAESSDADQDDEDDEGRGLISRLMGGK